MYISEAFDTYRDEVILFNGQSSRTLEMHENVRRLVLDYLGDYEVKDLTLNHIAKWRSSISRGRSQNTVRGYVLKLRMVIRHLNLKGLPAVNYELIGIPKRQNKIVSFLEPHEIDTLIDRVFVAHAGYPTLNRYRNRAIVALLAASGIRVSELCSMDRTSIKSDGTFSILGKGNKARICFTDSRARQFIDEYLARRTDSQKALFVGEKSDKRVNKDTIDTIFRYATRKCGFSIPVTPHTIRHSFATDMLRHNTNLIYVQRFLGHESIQTTQMYTHVVDEDLRAIYREKHMIDT